ncbi:RNA polymerase sigma factor [Curtanaerobium respiraculi]|uniref:RNA polymerase sigma factor n=1 Tax=Curtanaerobium respiraculi TaxID=2949669 RepID=UPI0024B37724|nr:sigma-70 family RNA polymerase sigma factor [Curtanaerobium respiraculi]
MPRNAAHGLNPDRAREIAEECYGEVLAYCRRHAPARHDPADLAQETFLRFVRAQGYREQGKPIAYLMRIARSVCVDASREKRLETVNLDFEVAAGERSAVEEDLDAALANLPDEMREAVELRFGSGLGVGEVARAIGISRFSARRRINAALRLLEEELGEGDPDERYRPRKA